MWSVGGSYETLTPPPVWAMRPLKEHETRRSNRLQIGICIKKTNMGFSETVKVKVM